MLPSGEKSNSSGLATEPANSVPKSFTLFPMPGFRTGAPLSPSDGSSLSPVTSAVATQMILMLGKKIV